MGGQKKALFLIQIGSKLLTSKCESVDHYVEINRCVKMQAWWCVVLPGLTTVRTQWLGITQ